ncbi:MAG: hypothetical protein KAR38_06010, partial [Calditrichia bacterium]|nr:hypothetical protein [Calditrichia bacterium]
MSANLPIQEIKLKGIPSSAGIIIGPVFIYQEVSSFEFAQVTASNPEEEIKKLNKAIEKQLSGLKKNKKETEKSYGPKLADLFSLQIGLLEDKYLIQEIEAKIKKDKVCASYSVYHILSDKKKYFLKLNNEYFRDRAIEIQDMKRKLINIIEKRSQVLLQDKPAIIIAHDLSPADTMKMYQNNVMSFVTETGGINSHAAIMGRALDVPSVVGCQGIVAQVKNGEKIIVDGINGEVILNPTDKTIEFYKQEAKAFHEFEKRMLKTNVRQAYTKDKVKVNV